MSIKEKHVEPQVISDYKTNIFRLYHRTDLREDVKLQKLEALAAKFATGWPFGDKSTVGGYGAGNGYRNSLERLTRTLHECIKRQALVRDGRNLGKMDRTELDSAKVHSTDKKKEPE